MELSKNKSVKRPQKLYVFTRREYLDALICKGQIRLGVIEEYRKCDGKSGARSDQEEASLTWSSESSVINVTPDHPLVKERRLFIADNDIEGATFDIGGGAIVFQDNAFVLCTCCKITPNTVKRMMAEFGSTALYKIENIELFIKKITDCLEYDSRICEGKYVTYTSTKKLITDPNPKTYSPDAFLKDISYGWQREFRFIWPCKPERMEGLVLFVPDLKEAISEVAMHNYLR